MAYCVEADLDKAYNTKHITQFTLDDATANPAVRDAAKIAAAIAAVEGEIDDELRDQYTVPLDPVPASIKEIAIWFALYRLACRRESISATIAARYEQAKAKLAAIKAGTVALIVAESAAGASLRSTTENVEPTFSRTLRRTDGSVIDRPGSTEVW